MLISTCLATSFVYRWLGWALLLIAITLVFGRGLYNWMCPYGTLHQFVSRLFSVRPNAQCIELNPDFRTQYLKYVILIVFLVMASMRALQIGRLDPIVMMYRALTAFFTPASDLAIGQLGGAATTLRANQ